MLLLKSKNQDVQVSGDIKVSMPFALVTTALRGGCGPSTGKKMGQPVRGAQEMSKS